MKVINALCTTEEYLAEGFSLEEAPIMFAVDVIFNHWDEYSEREHEWYSEMVEKLGL